MPAQKNHKFAKQFSLCFIYQLFLFFAVVQLVAKNSKLSLGGSLAYQAGAQYRQVFFNFLIPWVTYKILDHQAME